MFLPALLSLLVFCSTQEPASGPITVAAASEEVPAEAVAFVQEEAGPILQSMQATFGLKEVRPFRVTLHASGADLPHVLSAMHHEGSPGFALLSRHEVHVMLREAAQNPRGLRSVLIHEIAHELLDQACGAHGKRIPRWFHEGLAQTLAGDTYLGASEEMIVWRAATGNLIPFYELEQRFPDGRLALSIAYAQSFSFVSWLARERGISAVIELARAVDTDITLEHALVHSTGRSTEWLNEQWRQHLVHGSGAAWRSALSEFFPLSLVLLLPVLALALIRRLKADGVARERLIQNERQEAARAAELSTQPADPMDPSSQQN